MKKLGYFALIISLSVALFSCKKEKDENSTAPYYIKGKKDGTAFTFTTNAMAKVTDYSASNLILLNMIANGNEMEGFNFGVNFFNGSDIKTGTYTEEYSGTDYLTAGVYNPNSSTIVYGAGLHPSSAKPFVIKILTKTDSEITGTFEGAFYKQDVSNGTMYDDYILFSEGEFKLQIK